jgi:hypothetical protein
MYCDIDRKVLEKKEFRNFSGFDIPAGTPVSVDEKSGKESIRIANPVTDKSIIGMTADRISNQSSGIVYLGDGDPGCVSDLTYGRYQCNLIPNFDTSKFKKGQPLYFGRDGKISNKKSGSALNVGSVFWRGKADPESYSLNLGKIYSVEVGIWKAYESAGSSCEYMSEDEISPLLTCELDEDGFYKLYPISQGESVGDVLYEKTGFDPDANSWGLIAISLVLVWLIFTAVKQSSKKFSVTLGKTIFFSLVAAMGIFSLVAIYVNIIDPIFKNNPVDYSKKFLGIPMYFYLIPTMLTIALRNLRK